MMFLRSIEQFQLHPSATVETGMPATFVFRERSVFAVNVTIPRFQLFEERAVLDATAADIVGETGKE